MSSLLPLDYAEVETLYSEISACQARTIALTSCLGSAGVSMTAFALARRAALDEYKVLLVDMNQATPSLHQHIQQPRQRWTLDPGEWQPSVIEVDTNFHLLCASSSPDHPGFHSKPRIQKGLDSMSETYQLVILDASPLNRRNRHNTPPEMVCSAADAAVLCLMTGVCTESQLMDAHERLQRSHATLLGVVMNDRFAPGLLAELVRETHRLDRWFPRLAERLRARLKRSILLQQQL